MSGITFLVLVVIMMLMTPIIMTITPGFVLAVIVMMLMTPIITTVPLGFVMTILQLFIIAIVHRLAGCVHGVGITVTVVVETVITDLDSAWMDR